MASSSQNDVDVGVSRTLVKQSDWDRLTGRIVLEQDGGHKSHRSQMAKLAASSANRLAGKEAQQEKQPRNSSA